MDISPVRNKPSHIPPNQGFGVSGGFTKPSFGYRPVGSGAIARIEGGPVGESGEVRYQPISNLNPYQNRWIIKGRVSQKGDLRRYQNARGEGTVFSFEVTDDSGNIKVTSFKETADRLYNLVQMGKIYSISKASLKMGNPQYVRTSSQYEMTFDTNSEIQELPDDGSVSKIKYKFVRIADLESTPSQSFVDVVAVVKDVSEVQELTSRTTGQPLIKRTVTLIDDSLKSVVLTVWGQTASSLIASAEGNPTLLCRSVRRGDYNGVSLDALRSSSFELNPDLPEAHALRGWFDATDGMVATTNLSGGGMSSRSQERKLLNDAKNEEGQQATSDKGMYFTSRATVKFIKRDRLYYMACPETNKKVVEVGPGRYRCEATDKEYDHCNFRYTISLNIVDSSEGIWVSAFDEVGQALFGRTAKELEDIKNNDPDMIDAIMYDAQLTTHIFRVRAKIDNYRDEHRVKYTVFSMEKLDPVAESRVLLNQIRAFGLN